MKLKLTQAQQKSLKRIGVTVLSIFIIFYVILNVWRTGIDSVTTVTAFEKTVNLSVSGEAYFIRKESLVRSSETGVVVPVAVDGKKVAGGDPVALSFRSEKDAANYAQSVRLEQEKARFEKLDSLATSVNTDSAALEHNVNEAVKAIVAQAQSGSFSGIGTLFADLRDVITRKQLMLGESIDFERLIDEASDKLGALNASGGSSRVITANEPGYFIGNVDGCEDAYDYDEIGSITVDQVDKLFKYEPKKQADNVMGKLITGFNWYVVCNFGITEVSDMDVGDTVTISFPYASTSPVKGFVHAINNDGSGRVAVVVRSNVMNEELANVRQAPVELIYGTVTGYRIPSEAVREKKEDDGSVRKGVYILRSQMVSFREINIVYSEKDFVLSATETSGAQGSPDYVVKPNEVKTYDEIIVRGKDLDNGKAIS